MSGRLKGKVAVITGAGSGIGEATANLFHREGAAVVLADVSGREKSVASQLGDRALAVHVDVSQSSDVRAMLASAVDEYGGIDILCNIAGVDGPLKPLADSGEEDFKRIINVNLRGVFLGMKYAIPLMIERGGGSIVNMASAAGLVVMPGMSIYGASKAAVIQLTKSAAFEYAAQKIRVNAICPGLIDTPMIDKIREVHPAVEAQAAAVTPMGRIGQSHEIAAAALFLVSDEASFITGTAMPVDGGYVLP